MRDDRMYYGRGGGYDDNYIGRGSRGGSPRSRSWEYEPEGRVIGFRGGGSDDWGSPGYNYNPHNGGRGGWDDDWEPRSGGGRHSGGNYRGRQSGGIRSRYSEDDDDDYHTEDGKFMKPMDKKTAEEWVSSMKNRDGSDGEHWSYTQAARMMKEFGIRAEPAEFYAVLNAMWSDYSDVAAKFAVDKPEFWASLAGAWLMDDDAKVGKAKRYYECIVE